MLPILRVTLPSSVRTLWKSLHRHAEVCLQGESKSCQVGESDITGILKTRSTIPEAWVQPPSGSVEFSVSPWTAVLLKAHLDKLVLT